MAELPLVDVAPLVDGERSADRARVAAEIDAACRAHGFFLITGHGVDPGLQTSLDAAARTFFARPDEEKAAIAMARGGRTWRGWFPLDGELTSGVPDGKEGIYFGAELGPDDPRVRAGLPLHGPNLFPPDAPALRTAVLAWIEAMSTLGHQLMGGVALALGLEADAFARDLVADPTVLFRIFRYPPDPSPAPGRWGVAEHTDYGLLTILAQDASGGLQVRSPDGWIDVPAVPGTFVVNLGDMLDRMTAGRYRSTPHRVRPTTADRLSFPFFFDPGWDAEIGPLDLPGERPPDDATTRWDATSVHALCGTYGAYLWSKVRTVFPDLTGDPAEGHGNARPPKAKGDAARPRIR